MGIGGGGGDSGTAGARVMWAGGDSREDDGTPGIKTGQILGRVCGALWWWAWVRVGAVVAVRCSVGVLGVGERVVVSCAQPE